MKRLEVGVVELVEFLALYPDRRHYLLTLVRY